MSPFEKNVWFHQYETSKSQNWVSLWFLQLFPWFTKETLRRMPKTQQPQEFTAFLVGSHCHLITKPDAPDAKSATRERGRALDAARRPGLP